VRRFSVNQSTTRRWTFDRDVEFYAGAGVPAIGVSLAKLEDFGIARGVRLVRELELRVSCLCAPDTCDLGDRASEERLLERLRRALETAGELGADSLLVYPGASQTLSWEECAALSRPLLDSLLSAARAAGVRLVVEPTQPLRADLSFLHSFEAALGFVAEQRSPWLTALLPLDLACGEPALYRNIRYRNELIGLVRVADRKFTAMTVGELAVPGDGDVPLRRLCRALSEAGYRGWYDIDLSGTAIETEGYESVVPRAMARFLEL
jgi:sugar phosphate isomerase/epimerase